MVKARLAAAQPAIAGSLVPTRRSLPNPQQIEELIDVRIVTKALAAIRRTRSAQQALIDRLKAATLVTDDARLEAPSQRLGRVQMPAQSTPVMLPKQGQERRNLAPRAT